MVKPVNSKLVPLFKLLLLMSFFEIRHCLELNTTTTARYEKDILYESQFTVDSTKLGIKSLTLCGALCKASELLCDVWTYSTKDKSCGVGHLHQTEFSGDTTELQMDVFVNVNSGNKLKVDMQQVNSNT